MLQYYADSNEAESWMKEKMVLVKSADYGKDESSAKVGLHLEKRCLWDNFIVQMRFCELISA